MNPILELKNINHFFGGLKAVSNLNFAVPEKSIYGLIGPNGAGKTTVFNLITGIYQADQGEILFNGKNIVGKKTYNIVRAGIARTFQNLRIFESVTVLDNIRMALHASTETNLLQGILRTPAFLREERELTGRAMDLLARLHLEQHEGKKAGALAYGEQRRLEIARALATKPQLLLLDEPAAGMNPKEVSHLMELITDIHKQFDISILLIEHHMKIVMGMCDAITVIDFGEPIAQGRPEEIANDPRVLEAYLGKKGKTNA